MHFWQEHNICDVVVFSVPPSGGMSPVCPVIGDVDLNLLTKVVFSGKYVTDKQSGGTALRSCACYKYPFPQQNVTQ